MRRAASKWFWACVTGVFIGFMPRTALADPDPPASAIAELSALALAARGPAPTQTVSAWLEDHNDEQLDAVLAAPYLDIAPVVAGIFRHGDGVALARAWRHLESMRRPERSALMQRAARSAGANPAAREALLAMLLGDDLATSVGASNYLAEAVDDDTPWSDTDLVKLAAGAPTLALSAPRGVAVAVLARRCTFAAGQIVATKALASDASDVVRAAAVPSLACEAKRTGRSGVAALLDVASDRKRWPRVRVAAVERIATLAALAPLTDRDRDAVLRQFTRWRDRAAVDDDALALAEAALDAVTAMAHHQAVMALITTLSDRWPTPLVGAALAALERHAVPCPAEARIPLVRLAQSPFAELAMPAERLRARCFPAQ